MVLAIDIGNSNIVLGVYRDGSLLFSTRIKTDPLRTETEYAVLIYNILMLHQIECKRLAGAAVSSVVPSLTGVLRDAVGILGAASLMVVGPGVKTGLNIRIDDPAQLGSDLCCTAVGAMEKYPLPAIIIDLGTATKISVVDKNKNFIGGAIAPGVMVSLGALSRSAAQLPVIGLNGDIRVIGTNTVDCMLSGSILGTASMIDGMLDRYGDAIGGAGTTVACGGLVETVIPHCHRPIRVDKNLLLDGLYAIYRKNTPQP
jgi:type III pantothenate kinase